MGCIEDEDSNLEGDSCTNAPGLNVPFGVAVSGDGTSVYVTSQFDNAVAHLSRNPGTGVLSFQDCIEDEDTNFEGLGCADHPGLENDLGIAVSGDGTSVYVTSSNDDAIVHFSRNPGTGVLSFQGCVEGAGDLEGLKCSNAPGMNGAFGVAVSGDGTSVYVTSAHAVVHFSRDPGTGALGFQDCIEDEDTNFEGASCANAPGLANPKGIAVSGTSAYVGSGDDDAVAHLSLDPGTGALGFVDCIEDEDNNSEGASCTNAPGLDGALGVALSGDGTSVYVAGFFDDAVTHFSRNPGNGALGFQDCVEDEDSNLEGASCANAPGLDTPRWVAVSGDGASTYVASASDDAVVNFSRNPGTGALGFAGCVEDEDSNLEGASCANAPGLDGPQGVALSSDGASVYVASGGDDAIVHLSRETPPPPPSPPPSDGGGGNADTAPPDTTITQKPKDKTKKTTATFAFTSTEPGSTFQCAVDGQALKACTSPYTVKVKKGKHTFQVRATDAAGNTDPTSATDAWKVKKKRKK